MNLRIGLFFTAMLLALLGEPALGLPLGPGFTYQGQLKFNGSPITGTKHLRFSLWDSPGVGVPPVGGNQIGASQLVTNVSLTNGMFTVYLNSTGQFGPTAFNGDARWLHIEICEDPGCATLTILSPRQLLTAAPFSSYSAFAGPWKSSGSDVVLPDRRLGIGTDTPSNFFALHVKQLTGDLQDCLWVQASGNGKGILATSENNAAVDASSNGSGPGVYAENSGGKALWGQSLHGTAGYFYTETGTAGDFQGPVNITGGTKLGEASPSIKIKRLGGTTASTEGQAVAISHGVDDSKIIAINVMVEFAQYRYVANGYTVAPGYEFSWHTNIGSIVVWNKTGNSGNILSRPIWILITYEE